jgi:DNA topoisomerase II
MSKKTKTIEETYKKLTQREHVLERPGMYIGSIKKQKEELWVMNSDGKMEKRAVNYSPGFMKIFDEVLTNATDHSFRDDSVTQIKVDYNKETGEISVWNNGSGIPVIEHKEHNMYVPELIFGHLLSGSNYDDTQQRTGAGTNGIGSKASNIYSKHFVIETVDSENKKKFVQEYSNNMIDKTKPKITSNSTKSYTKITFIPDYPRFEMNGLEDDAILLINKRVYDCIAVTNPTVSVFLNGEKLKGKGMSDYIKYFFEDEKVISESQEVTIGKTVFNWEYAIVPYSEFEQVSFVNGNATTQGGTHVNNIITQILNKYKKMLEDKKKLKELKPNFIKDKLFLFLRATVVNPAFNSQTKEQLTTPTKDFGCNITVSDKFIEKLYKSPITDEIVEFCKLKETSTLAKTTDGKKVNKLYIPKLEDALWAGTAKSNECTLILTEGDSAKTFALWGRSVTGPEKYGVMPLKGKVLNVRDATIQQLIGNEELNNIKQIIGLKQDRLYKNTNELRYGHVMILTDADTDGSHIKALFVNFIHAYWPSLLKINPNFIQTLKTPIVKAIKGKTVLEFFTEQDYIKWKEATPNHKSYQIRYFKGLGTSKKEDAKETFKRIEELKVEYYLKDDKCEESILLAFDKDKNVSKGKKNTTEQSEGAEGEDDPEAIEGAVELKCSDKRKKWLGGYDKNSYIQMNENRVSYQDLINKELIHFSIYDNTRSIPSLCDGLKPSQRKILFYMLKNNVTKVMKVAQLSGYVSAETGYHHGEASLNQAIIGMAQNFTGSNNINLLYPDGNFGSALLGGKDAASPRYIFTRLENYSQDIFNQFDNPLLNYLNDDGVEIEPEFYMPVIPMILVNGCSGIGTGYSTYIPPYNPKDIIANLKRVLNNDDQPLKMKPYFRGFNGVVEDIGEGSFITRGKWEKLSDTQIKVTELPVGTWVTTYKEFLESLIEKDTSSKKTDVPKKRVTKKVVLKDVQNKTRDESTGICFIIEFKNAGDLQALIASKTLEKELKLTKTFSTNNMYLFDENLILNKYTNPNDILLDFYDIRIEYYQARKVYMVKKLKREFDILDAKRKFIKEYVEGTLDINRKSKDYIIELLTKRGYPTFAENERDTKDYEYLLRIPIGNLSMDKIKELENQLQKKKDELDYYKTKTREELWNIDLDNLLKKLN